MKIIKHIEEFIILMISASAIKCIFSFHSDDHLVSQRGREILNKRHNGHKQV